MSKSLKTLLNSSSEFRAILNKTQGLCEIQDHFNEAVPTGLAQHAQVASLEFGTLTIIANNPTVAAKLRQLAPEILAKLKNGGVQVSGIRFKVQVYYTPPAFRGNQRHLSQTARNALRSLEEDLADSPLKDALKRMSEAQSN